MGAPTTRTAGAMLVTRGDPRAPAPPGPSVGASADLTRVLALPMRRPPADWAPDALEGVARELTAQLRAPEGTQTLRPLQAAALWELRQHVRLGKPGLHGRPSRGLLVPQGVGAGKTLVTLLAPRVALARRPVLLTFASLREKTLRDRARAADHWDLGPAALEMPVLTWEQLGSLNGADLLQKHAPDLVIADECHAVRNPNAARTLRFMRYFESIQGAGARLVALSGTITSHALADFAHLAAIALGEGSPAPLTYETVCEWDRALGDLRGPDAPARLAPGPLARWAVPGETARQGYQRRLTGTHGVVATSTASLETGLEITVETGACNFLGPCEDACARVLRAGCDDCGNEAESTADLTRMARAAGLGYALHLEWGPGGPDAEWLGARRAWARACRRFLETPGCPYDSPGTVAAAVEAQSPGTAGLWGVWCHWANVRGRANPVLVPQFDDSALGALSRYVLDWARDTARVPSIVWVPSPHLGEALAARNGLPWYGPDNDPSGATAPTIMASARAHGVGKNLQHYARNLILSPPSSAAVWEQLLGRTHRPGQLADTVSVTVLAHIPPARAALARARKGAEYIEHTTGQAQRLRLATWPAD